MTNYVVASSKDWFDLHTKSNEYKNLNIFNIRKQSDLNIKFLEKIKPRYIFFPHWSWKVDPQIFMNYECVAFHTAPLPYGRGGSPIQNLIVRGIDKAPVCALRMTDIIDGGPIYGSIEISLDGTITQIFSKIALSVEKLIIMICQTNINPIEQNGQIVKFNRMTFSDNELFCKYSLIELYDRIRMVDGLDYPRAYINFGKYKIEVTDASLNENYLLAKIKLKVNN